MANNDNRDWTVIVMRQGRATRNYSIGRLRRVSAALSLALVPLATSVIGYHWGTQDKLAWMGPALASLVGIQSRASTPPHTTAGRAQPTLTATNASVHRAHAGRVRGAPATGPSAKLPPQELGDVDLVGGEPQLPESDEGTPEDKELSLRLETNGEVVEILPYSADGRPRRAAFHQLRDAMACKDGRSAVPNARLVRLMVDAHQRFGTPVSILGGHCGAHEDRAEAARHHAEGRAADIRVRGVSTARLTGWLEEKQLGGLGRYARGRFVHVDLRPGKRARWEPAAAPKNRQAARSKPRKRRSEPKTKVVPAKTLPAATAAAKPTNDPKPAGPEGPTGAKQSAATTRAKALSPAPAAPPLAPVPAPPPVAPAPQPASPGTD